MKKKFLLLFCLLATVACMSYPKPPLGEQNFPLERDSTIPVDGRIQEIAVADSWMAVHTEDKIIAIDIDTQVELWSMDFEVITYGTGFITNNDNLIAASSNQIVIINKLGKKREINLDSDVKTITRILTVSSNYLYVVGGPKWTLETYDVSTNKMLWKMDVGRTVGKVFYDSLNDVAYLTNDDSLRALDNLSGKLLWEMKGVFGQSTFFREGILYVSEPTNVENAYKLTAIKALDQKKLWEKDIVKPINYSVSNRTIIDNLLITSGYGMIAINITNGEEVWAISEIGEEFYTTPVYLDGVLYVKGLATGAIYAISVSDGAILGHARLENISSFDVASGGLDILKDGIVFNTRNSIIIYKNK